MPKLRSLVQRTILTIRSNQAFAIAMTLANGLNHCILRPTAGPSFRLTTWQVGHFQCGSYASKTATRRVV
jgi:hypothetical protein